MRIKPMVKNDKVQGMTLIEVLIALSIIAIALTAILKATSQAIQANNYLERKTHAALVGQMLINSVLGGIIKLPIASPEPLTGQTKLFEQIWYWQLMRKPTLNKNIFMISAEIYQQPDQENSPIVTLDSYQYYAATTNNNE
jgi:general secretion pathway protein I